MIDLHTHTLFSDGELLPFELVRRAEIKGYEAIALTDHADVSNYDFIIPRIMRACQKLNQSRNITAIPGIELTHVPPDDISQLARDARKLGACIVVVHGETVVEPVMPGTNASALQSEIDILSHPGLISEDEVKIAAKKGIFLEISARKGHSLSNGHVSRLAKKHNASLVLNTDTHSPDDLISLKEAEQIALGAGLLHDDVQALFRNSRMLVDKALRALKKHTESM